MTIEMVAFDSKSELASFLHRDSRSYVVLGEEADAPREFYCVTVRGTPVEVNIGVFSFGIGVKPGYAVRQNRLMIGFNDQIASMDLATPKSLRQTDLLALFWQFLLTSGLTHLCVLCETAVIGVTSDAEIIWRVDTNLVKSSRVTGSSVRLEFTEGVSMNIDLTSGQVRTRL